MLRGSKLPYRVAATPQASRRVRSSVTKALFAGIDRLPADTRKAVLSRLPERLPVREGLALGWTTAEEYHQVVNPLFEVLGPDGFRDFYAHEYERIAQLPILGSITAAALRVGGGTPQGLAKYAGRTWKLIAMGLGTLVVVEGSDPVRLRYLGYPRDLGPDDLFAYAFAGAFDGFYILCRTLGRSEIVDIDTENGNATFDLPR